MLSIERLISHRFRGFSQFENSLDGLNTALDFGVSSVEFDIRVAKCGTPMIYHDEYALNAHGEPIHLADVMALEFSELGGTFARIPTANALFSAVAAKSGSSATLLIDIKDAGFEEEINALVNLYTLQTRVIYVSWVPEALYAIHKIAPNTPLCLSHWCKNPSDDIRAKHKVHTATAGSIPRPTKLSYIHGQRSGWFLETPVSGEMRDILVKTRGWVCVPQNMVTKSLVERYHALGIKVSTFSYVSWDHIIDHSKRFEIDAYFIDDKVVFDAVNSKA